MCQLRIHAFVLPQFTFHLFHALQIGGRHACLSRLSVLIGRITDAVATVNVFGLHPDVGFFQDRNDLCFGKSASFHQNLLVAILPESFGYYLSTFFGEAYAFSHFIKTRKQFGPFLLSHNLNQLARETLWVSRRLIRWPCGC